MNMVESVHEMIQNAVWKYCYAELWPKACGQAFLILEQAAWGSGFIKF